MAELTPMMRQYLEIKQRHPDCLLFSVWAISMKCSPRTRVLPRRSWISP